MRLTPREVFFLICLGLLSELRSTPTISGTSFVAALSIANQDLERYLRTVNASQQLGALTEDRIVMDVYTYAFINYSYRTPEYKEVTFAEEKARYGEGKIGNVYGKLIHVTDYDDIDDDTACTYNLLGTRGDPLPAPGHTWIALVRRGRCTFEEKVKNVYNKGANGIIVYNDKPVSNLEKMQIKGRNRNITAVITYQEIGMEMANIVDQGYEMHAAIMEGRSGMRPINTLNRTSVLFVSISFIVLMVISLVWLIFYYIQRFRYLQTKDQQSRQLCTVTKKAIMKIPTKTGKSSDEKDDSDCCAICIESYRASDCIRVLPCKHEFHKACIDPWLIEHRTCPMCKLDVLKFYGYVFLGSEESILEYEANRPADGNAAASSSNAAVRTDAATDLIRSREFVVDFSRLLLMDLNGAGNMSALDTTFPARIPERSQSALSLTKDWMSQISNKLDEQHGLQRFRRSGARNDDMQENLLSVRSDSMKKRRSRSADGRYSSGSMARRELMLLHQQPMATDRRNSVALRDLTEASYAQSRQRQQEERTGSSTRRRSISQPRDFRSEDMPRCSSPPRSLGLNTTRESSPPLNITIQVNGEGVDFE